MKIARILALCSLWLALATVTAPMRAAAGEPTEQLRTTIDEFVHILVNTPVPELRTKGLPDKALALIFGRFDFAEMTKRSLGPHWNPLAPSEQREFVEAFTQRLLVAYGRTVRASGEEKIRYDREAVDGDQTTVETKVIGGGDELGIDYRMHAVEGQWKVYDMVIDKVSIVDNYRAQFDRVIARSSVKELLQRMKQQNS
jgi:phospholipid transport system substrate-binding protein